MKKIFVGLIICAATIACVKFISYSNEYRIPDDKKQLENFIMDYDNSELMNNVDEVPEIRNDLDLDDKKFIFSTFTNFTGYTELKKGFNDKYKIISQGRDGNYIDNRVFETNKGKYLVFWGKNPHRKISSVSAELEGKRYRIMIPEKEYYMSYCKVPADIKNQFSSIENIKLFDKDDIDISDEMFEVLLRGQSKN